MFANGKDYSNLQKLFEIWHHFGLCDKTRMEYWHLKSLLNVLVEQNDRSDLVLPFLKLTHDLKLFDYTEVIVILCKIKIMESKKKSFENYAFMEKRVDHINEWIKFVTSTWNMDKIQISNAVMGQILFWNEVHSLDGMMEVCNSLNLDPAKLKLMQQLSSIVGEYEKKITSKICLYE